VYTHIRGGPNPRVMVLHEVDAAHRCIDTAPSTFFVRVAPELPQQIGALFRKTMAMF
jgi:hypothetical protein